MATKQAMIEALQAMLQIKDEVIPLYARHTNNPLFLSELSAEDRQEVAARLNTLFDESRRHKTIFENMIRMLQETGKDVY